jgi:hypothetical protein
VFIVIRILYCISLEHQFKGNEMGESCGTHRKLRKLYYFFLVLGDEVMTYFWTGNLLSLVQ